MKTKARENKKPSILDDTSSSKHFKMDVKKAEKGPFYSIAESKELISEWRKEPSSVR